MPKDRVARVGDQLVRTAPSLQIDDDVERDVLRLAERLRAGATTTDLALTPPLQNIRELADAGLLALPIPTVYGGRGASAGTMFWVQETLASACGVTTFVAVQLFGCISQLASSPNEPLKQAVLPLLARGERFGGVAFSHVRRSGAPLMRVTPEKEGYRFDGDAPWFTGWGVMTDTILAGMLPDDTALFAFVPLDTPGLSASAPMRLAAMESAMTVTLRADALWIPAGQVTTIVTRDEMTRRDRMAVIRNAAFPIGVAQAALGLLQGLEAQRTYGELHRVIAALERETAAVRNEIRVWLLRQDNPGFDDASALLRARAIAVSMRAAHAAIVATGGAANLVTNPAQRLLREALAYSLVSQTTDVRAATLDRLSR